MELPRNQAPKVFFLNRHMFKKNYLNKHLFLILFWLVLGFAVWIQIKDEFNALQALFHTSLIMVSSIVVSQWLSDRVLPEAIKTRQMKPFVLKAIAFVIILAILIGGIDYYFILTKEGISNHERTDLILTHFYQAIPSSLLINGTACGIRFYQEHADIQRIHGQLQQNFLESQVKFLQDQVNPHFMFNVLNHIHILMKKNVEMADYLLLKFSDILRYQLYECNQPLVLLTRELQYLQDFIAIEKMRWGNELDVSCSWNQSSKDLYIAPLMLICFVENAFKHVNRLPNQKGSIELSCVEEEGKLQFNISNSYQDYPQLASTGHSGIGLENVKKRLELQYENNYSLTIHKLDNSFTIQLTIDLNS